MRNILSVFLSVLLVGALLAFAGCGGRSDSGETASPDAGQTQEAEVSAEESDAKNWSDGSADITYYIADTDDGVEAYLVITNQTDEDFAISLEAYPKDASGADLSESPGWVNVNLIAPGRTTLYEMQLPVDNAEAVDMLEFKPNYGSSAFLDCTPDMDVKSTPDETGVAVEVTNNGEKIAQGVYAYVLFFDASGKMIGESKTRIGNVEAGASGSGTVAFDGDFARFELYIVGQYGL